MPHQPTPGPAAAASRRATADPSRFLIPADQLPPGFAERVDGAAGTPAALRPAATIALVRPGTDAEPEVLLLRRPRRSAFAADAWVFPGGVVDDADRAPELGEHALGPAAREWAQRLELENANEALGYVVAAIREAWEETGILLAEGEASPDADLLGEERRRVLGGELPLLEAARRHGLRLATDRLIYIAHWITPEPEPRRYDTRFFVARVPAGTECTLHGDELVEARWLAPGDAVSRFRAGELKLLPPTVHTLQRLAGFASLDALWQALRDAPVPVFLPRMRRVPEGVVIELE